MDVKSKRIIRILYSNWFFFYYRKIINIFIELKVSSNFYLINNVGL